MVVAYLLTSGLSCQEVHAQSKKGNKGWQWPQAYYNSLFARPPNLSSDKLRRIPVLQDIARLDPGMRATRKIDERLINEQGIFPKGEIDLQFPVHANTKRIVIDAANGIDEIIGNPRNQAERLKEASLIQNVVRSLRRRAFFDSVKDEETRDGYSIENEALRKLGFGEGGKFTDVINKGLSSKRSAELKRSIIAGLHTIQGLQLSAKSAMLHLVDPAFGSATSHAAIIAGTIATKDIKLIPLSEKWEIDDALMEYSLPKSCDWLDRHVVLRVLGENNQSDDLLLDLLSFDCIVRAGSGYVAAEFYAHDVRRILSFLGRLAESRKATGDQITLFLGGAQRSVSIDDGLIEVSGGDST